LLTHKTSVAYSWHRSGPAAALQELIKNGSFSVISPVPPTTLQKISMARNVHRKSQQIKKLF
jgi:hypothetical protein